MKRTKPGEPVQSRCEFAISFAPIWIAQPIVEVSTPGVGWSWGSTLTPNYGGLGGGGVGTQQLSN